MVVRGGLHREKQIEGQGRDGACEGRHPPGMCPARNTPRSTPTGAIYLKKIPKMKKKRKGVILWQDRQSRRSFF